MKKKVLVRTKKSAVLTEPATAANLCPKVWVRKGTRRLRVVRWPRVLLWDPVKGIKFWTRVKDVAARWEVELPNCEEGGHK
jgi:hypothetical protein